MKYKFQLLNIGFLCCNSLNMFNSFRLLKKDHHFLIIEPYRKMKFVKSYFNFNKKAS